jgi:hypothetical protein
MASIPELFINVVTVEGVKLSLTEGDILAVMVPSMIGGEQRARMMAYLEGALPTGVKAIIFDGGITIAALSTKKLKAYEDYVAADVGHVDT